jgi:TolB-like protein
MERAVMKALAKVPMDRFASPGEFANALRLGNSGEPVVFEKSIAVLPFDNLSGDTECGEFADGITEETGTDLSSIEGLKVTSRTSAARFKGTTHDVRTIGRELNVRYLVHGSVRRVRANLRVTAQVIDAASDTPLWSQKFDGASDDPLAVQQRISQSVVEAVRVKLGVAGPRSVPRREVDNVHAHECRLRARRDLWRFTEAAVIHALQYLQEALDIVGENVLLYAGIAEAYFLFPSRRRQ